MSTNVVTRCGRDSARAVPVHWPMLVLTDSKRRNGDGVKEYAGTCQGTTGAAKLRCKDWV